MSIHSLLCNHAIHPNLTIHSKLAIHPKTEDLVQALMQRKQALKAYALLFKNQTKLNVTFKWFNVK